jgi:hypothetical protein
MDSVVVVVVVVDAIQLPMILNPTMMKLVSLHGCVLD